MIRKLSCVMPVLLLVLLLQAGAALAFPNTPYAADTCTFYARLTETQQLLLDQLYAGAADHQEQIELPAGTAYDDVEAVLSLMLTDFPELCDVENTYRIGYYLDTPDIANYVTLQYLPQEPFDREALLNTAQEIVASVSGSALERERLLHDALCNCAVYGEGEAQHSAVGALCEGKAVCEGYAKAFVLLLRLSGIPADVVIGEAVNTLQERSSHAWVYAVIDGVPTLVDPTWDDAGEFPNYAYFNRSASQMASDHMPDPGFETPDAVELPD